MNRALCSEMVARMIAGLTLAAGPAIPIRAVRAVAAKSYRAKVETDADRRYREGLRDPTQFLKGTTEEEREVRSWAFMHRPARARAMGSYVARACEGTRKQQAAMWPTVKAILERYTPEVLGVPRDLIQSAEWRGQRKILASILGLA